MSAVGEPFGLNVTFTAQPGKGDELAEVLLEAGRLADADDDCRLFMVSRSPTDPDAVYVTETWTSEEAHTASLQPDAAKALIARAMPLMTGRPEATVLRPLRGKAPSAP
jgi:quinol monooxygenase YgiN